MSVPDAIHVLDKEHRDALDLAIRNVLGTELALDTYGQVVDGLPLATLANDHYAWKLPMAHPVFRHTSLCPGARETAQNFLSEFATDVEKLNFDAALLEAYQSTQPGHRSFYCRLIELVAVAVHKLAVLLYRQDHRVHDVVWSAEEPAYTVEQVSAWESESQREYPDRQRPGPTLLRHGWYSTRDQYPDKDADVVGYWVENVLFGGVIMFDRSHSWGSDDAEGPGRGRPEPNVYLHSDRDRVTFRVWQTLDEQHQALVDFLVSSPPGDCPFPLSASNRNLKRFDPEVATRHKVYRDIWERKKRRGVFRCVRTSLDYPEEAVRLRKGNEAWERRMEASEGSGERRVEGGEGSGERMVEDAEGSGAS